MSWTAQDQAWMRDALAEAECAAKIGEVPVGAIVVCNGKIVGRGSNRSIRDSDPTAHAEILALRAAAAAVENYRLPGSVLYVTLEPCAMCMGAMLHARVTRIVFGAYDQKSGAAGSVLDLSANRNLNHQCEVNGGLLADQCGEILKDFFVSRR